MLASALMIVDLAGTVLDYAHYLTVRWWPLLAIGVLVAIAPPIPWRPRVAGLLDRIAGRPWLSALLVASLSLIWSVSLALVDGIPQPRIHDDYSVLLGGEMLARGHASYPTHPLWQHFEAFHVLHVPSYASKYPVGPQLVLAFGIVLAGIPLLGSWLVAAVAAIAIHWALRGAVTRAWAFAGGIAAAIHPVMLNWAESYRGGGLAAVGGALLFGAALRFADGSSFLRLGAIAGLGGAVLVVTRPFEGGVLALGCAVAITVRRLGSLRALVRPAVIAMAILMAALLGIGLHNRAVTGSPLLLPWLAYAEQYDPAPQFIGQADVPMPSYRNVEFRYVYTTMYRRYYESVMADGYLVNAGWQLDFLRGSIAGDPENRRRAVLWPLFLAPLVALPTTLRRSMNARVAFFVFLLFALAVTTQWVGLLAHYVAPVAAAASALMLLLLVELSASRRGRWLVAAVAVVYLASCVDAWRWWTVRADGSEPTRQALVRAAGEGRHLFVVAPDVHGFLANAPAIDEAPVVWARDLGDNRALLAHFSDRRIWQVVRSAGGYRLQRCVPPESHDRAVAVLQSYSLTVVQSYRRLTP